MYKNTRIGEVLYCNKVQHNGVLPTSLFYEHYSQNNCEIQYWVCKGVQLKQEVHLKSLPEFSLTVNNQKKLSMLYLNMTAEVLFYPYLSIACVIHLNFIPTSFSTRAAITKLI